MKRTSVVVLALLVVAVAFLDPRASSKQTTQPSKEIVWEELESRSGPPLLRTELPGGWLVYTDDGLIEFVPDPEKGWK